MSPALGINKSINKQGLSIYLLAAGCLLLAPWSEIGMEYFSVDRSELQDGEYWRFWTGQLVHSSWTHLILNMVGLIVLQQMFGNELNFVTWAWGYTVIALVISICWLAFGKLSWLPFGGYDYVVGLSAMLHGLFAYAACLAMRRDGMLAAGVLLIIGAKVVWENMYGPSELTADLIDLPIAVATHLYGFVGGLILGTVMTVSEKRRGA
jgi:rhomboid family GlyGly-CTERM serine protease